SLQQSPEQIEEIVHQAIQLMPAAHERMDVFMHPDDISLLRGLDLHWLANVSLRVDESLSPGGCTVKTRHSLLDYSLSQRYQAQIQALLDNDLPPPDDTLRALSLERFQTLVERLPGAPSTVPEHDDETDATVSSDDVEDDAAGADAETTEEDDVSGASAVPPKEDDVAGADPAPPEEDDHAQTE
ncbi:MAG: FliH/SctL family protein, partial [Natronospirillum sp.]